MHNRGVYLLYAMNAVGRDYKTIIREVWKSAAVFAGKRDGEHFFFFGRLKRVDQIRRFATGAEHHGNIAWQAQQAELVNEYSGKIEIVTNGGHRSDICHEWNHRERGSLLDNRMIELDTHVQRITQTAAVAHDKEPATFLKTSRQLPRHRIQRVRVFVEKLFFHLNAFAAFAEDFIAKAFVGLVDDRRTLIDCTHTTGSSTVTSLGWLGCLGGCKWRP